MTSAMAVRGAGARHLRAVPDAAVPDAAVPDAAVPDLWPTPGERLRAAGERVLVALLDRLSAMALEKVDDLAGSLERMAQEGGPGVGAAIGAARAMAQGRNAVWGAIKGGFAALAAWAKVLVGVVLALSPVLLLVALVVLVVALLVWAVVAAVRSAA
ncbi:hypothetical protein [Pseudonocardia endophytica]|uniref:Uncharacterized protein n=1 Tax=Pseudonocardia endophytica TaxID=401976 RepID=A0A4R1HYX4_PSEEN|nr:hypothetical protein [Pseudonocardia endophytica]TCK25309.1 hypothetical protein EV378_1113 [Pseudonocardia endophytica]